MGAVPLREASAIPGWERQGPSALLSGVEAQDFAVAVLEVAVHSEVPEAVAAIRSVASRVAIPPVVFWVVVRSGAEATDKNQSKLTKKRII
jgi:hypothetical protein